MAPAAGPPAAASITSDLSRPDQSEPSWRPHVSLPLAAQGAPAQSLPPLEGFIKHYEIIRTLGQGGMGLVLLARDTKLGRLVAIKLLQGRGIATARLLDEARITAQCRHDSIVVIYEVDELHGLPYMVLEYLEGRTLREVLSAGASRALPTGFALDIVTSVVRALAAAHERGVVHRDLKPENIMLLDTGQVKVLDFGMAQHGDPVSPGAFGGTLPYMAPEQWRREHIDARTDLWAVGVLVHELVAGAHPLAPLAPEQLASIQDLEAPMPRLEGVRPELAALSEIVERCLRKRPEERFGSAAELLAALAPLHEAGSAIALAEGELPFAGLSAFQESDAGRFFGRERDIATLVGRLRRQPLVAVAGPSGAGKSSFVRAGVIPALKRSGEDWSVVVLRPGRAPLAALAEALAQALGEGASGTVHHNFHAEPGLLGARLRAHCRARGEDSRALVFVDQLEELYTLVPDPGEQAAFIRSLLGAADDASSPLRVVLALRSDFVDRLADDRAFMAKVTAGLFLLPPVGREGLREALVRPVEAAGYRFEGAAMVTDILEELGRARTPLPLLQFGAAELWEARDQARKVLTRASYDRLGGVIGSLSAHADAVFAALSASDQRLCRAIFLRLVTPERTRAVASMAELASLSDEPAAAEALVQHLCDARLLHREAGGDEGSVTVELVHEALVERWPRLARWLDESTADAGLLARLRAAASQWQAGGEAPGLLWRDRAAEDARAWYERRRASPDAERDLPLGRAEERYLLAVIALLERARRRRQRTIAGAFALLGAISVLVLFLALRARSHAKRADEEAALVKQQNGELAFQALRGRNAMRMLAARKRQDDPTLVLALLREVEPEDLPKEWAELVSYAFTSGVARDIVSDIRGDDIPYAAAISPDGARIAVAFGYKTVEIVSASDYRKLATLRGHESFIYSALWSPDGARVVTASGDRTARIWSTHGSGVPLVLRGHGDVVNSAAMSPDGKLVVTASDDWTARVFSAEDGRQLTLLQHEASVNDARFSPDGKRIVTTSREGTARVWSADGKGTPLPLRGHTAAVYMAAWSPDGKRIATASADGTVRVWDASGGAELFTLRGHEDMVVCVAWSPDGTRIASGSRDKTVRLWNADGAGAPIVLRGHKHWVYTVSFSPDSRHLVTASLDKTLRRWDLDEIVTPAVLEGHTDIITHVGFSADSTRIVTASRDQTARVWSTDGTRPPVVLRGHTSVLVNAMLSPDGRRLLTGAEDRTVRIWSADGGSAPVVLEGHQQSPFSMGWSSGGGRIVAAYPDGVIRVWRSDGWELAREASVGPSAKNFVYANFDREGRRIVATNGHENIYLWDPDGSGGPVVLGRHDAGSDMAQWSPDGSRVVSASADKTARIWNVRGASAPIVLRGHEAEVTFAAWSPDGRRIVTTSADTTARVWNADGSGQPVILRGHGDTVWWASFSPDGTRIATASKDTTVRVWNADGSGAPFVLAAAPLEILNVVWSPDGKHVLPHAEEKVARVWPGVQPFVGPGDPRLWRATSYCIPASIRVDLLHVTEADARRDQGACERRVAEARALKGVEGGSPPRDSVGR